MELCHVQRRLIAAFTTSILHHSKRKSQKATAAVCNFYLSADFCLDLLQKTSHLLAIQAGRVSRTAQHCSHDGCHPPLSAGAFNVEAYQCAKNMQVLKKKVQAGCRQNIVQRKLPDKLISQLFFKTIVDSNQE